MRTAKRRVSACPARQIRDDQAKNESTIPALEDELGFISGLFALHVKSLSSSAALPIYSAAL